MIMIITVIPEYTFELMFDDTIIYGCKNIMNDFAIFGFDEIKNNIFYLILILY